LGRLEKRERVVVGNKRDLRTTLIMTEPLLGIEPQSIPKTPVALACPAPTHYMQKRDKPHYINSMPRRMRKCSNVGFPSSS